MDFYLYCCNTISRNLFIAQTIVFNGFYKDALNSEEMFFVKFLKWN